MVEIRGRKGESVTPELTTQRVSEAGHGACQEVEGMSGQTSRRKGWGGKLELAWILRRYGYHVEFGRRPCSREIRYKFATRKDK